MQPGLGGPASAGGQVRGVQPGGLGALAAVAVVLVLMTVPGDPGCLGVYSWLGLLGL